MPNIEIHGYGDGSIGLAKSDKAKARVIELIVREGLGEDVVITAALDETTTLDRKLEPFLRIYGTRKSPESSIQLDRIITVMQEDGFDVEEVQLAGFHAAKKKAPVPAD